MILAIDTCGNKCGTALWKEDLIGYLESNGTLRHNEILIEQIRTLFTDYSIDHSLIEAIAVSAGPGSFTGLRVGMSAAKGLCWSWNVPFIAISTLEGLAEAVPPRMDRVMPMMPARAKEVYWAIFKHTEKGWKRQCEDTVSEIYELKNTFSGEIFLFGEGYTKHHADLEGIFLSRIKTLMESEKIESLVVSTARLAAKRYQKGQFDDLMRTEPQYCYAFPRQKR